ncbi:RNA dependent RNA polymerase, partial [Enterobacter asburiae]
MSIPVTMDIQDKITVEPNYYNIDSIEKLIINNSSNRIGEYSNYSSCYHNKMKKTERTKKIHDDYISTLSIFVGKEVDASKTGIRFNLPKAIAKYARPIPYFMKYRSPYYATLRDFNKYRSNMNAMCFKIENWERKIKYTRTYDDFDYT